MKIHIRGRRWRDSNGNTIHTVEVVGSTASGDVGTLTSPRTYGYGSAYNQTALEMLVAAGCGGLPPGTDINRGLWYVTRDTGVEFDSTVVDVPRRKDLHCGGAS